MHAAVKGSGSAWPAYYRCGLQLAVSMDSCTPLACERAAVHSTASAQHAVYCTANQSCLAGADVVLGRPTKAMPSVGSQEADDIVDLLGFCWCKGHEITTQLQVEDFPMHHYPNEPAAAPHFVQWFKVSGALDSAVGMHIYGHTRYVCYIMHQCLHLLNCANLLCIIVTRLCEHVSRIAICLCRTFASCTCAERAGQGAARLHGPV